jgi:Flp pilus assembly protein CpaB
MSPAAPPTTTVLTAARDLPGGHRLTADDVREVAMPRDLVPSGALKPGSDWSRRMLRAPVRAGAPLTDANLLGSDLLDGRDQHLVAAPVRLADPGVLALVDVGDRVDVLAAPADVEHAGEPAHFVVRGARVVALPRRAVDDGLDGLGLGGAGGPEVVGEGLVVLAVAPHVAAELARSAVTSRLSLVLRDVA